MIADLANRCPWQLRAWPGDDGTFACRRELDHDGSHEATGLFDYQTIEWFPGDRREYTGEWVECASEGCVCPNGHPGVCAR